MAQPQASTLVTTNHVFWILFWSSLATLTSGATNFTQSICTLEHNHESSLTAQEYTLYLSCPQGGLIYILQAFYGRSMSDLCAYTVGDTCISNALYAEPVVACLGASTCSIPAMPILLQRCEQHSNYLHVKYQCLNGDEESKFNVCGYDFQSNFNLQANMNSRGHVALVPTGHIMSPHFPSNYPKLSYCDCIITAAITTSTRIEYEMLDFRLESSEACQYDFVEIVRADQRVGSGLGQRMCGGIERRTRRTINSHQARVVMKTDDNVEFRGFWLRVWAISGRTTKVPITVQCQHHALDANTPAKHDTGVPPRPIHPSPRPAPRPPPRPTPPPYPPAQPSPPRPTPPGDRVTPPPEGATTSDKRRIWTWTLPPATANKVNPEDRKSQEGFVSRNTGIIIGVCVVGLVTMVIINIVGIIICRRQMLANRAKRTPTSSGQGTNSLDSLTSLDTEYVSLNSNGASYHSGLSDANLYTTIVSAVGAHGHKAPAAGGGHGRGAAGHLPNYEDGVVIERTPGVGSPNIKPSDYDYGVLPATYTRKTNVAPGTHDGVQCGGRGTNHGGQGQTMAVEDPYATLRRHAISPQQREPEPTYATIDRRKSLRRSLVRVDYADYQEIESCHPDQSDPHAISPGLQPDQIHRRSLRLQEPEYVYVRPQTRPEEIPFHPQPQLPHDPPAAQSDSGGQDDPESTYAHSDSSTARSEYL